MCVVRGVQAHDVLAALEGLLKDRGLGIVAPLALQWYNDALPADIAGHALVTQAPAHERALVVLVGNGAELWRQFLSHCVAHPEQAVADHPLDRYVELVVGQASRASPASPSRVVWAHRATDQLVCGRPGYAGMQRAAMAAGLTWLDPVCRLLMHPDRGQWLAIRALLVFDGVEWEGTAPTPLPCPVSEAQLAIAHERGRQALQAASGGARPEREQVERVWKLWVAAREALHPGHPQKYCTEQLEYHYTRNKELLKKAIAVQAAREAGVGNSDRPATAV